MATPFKRVCYQATRYTSSSITHSTRCCRWAVDLPQWQQPVRQLSTIHPRAARPSTQNIAETDNAYITSFPEGSEDSAVDLAYEDDEISSLGHAELDQHRELRDMIRLAAWEMPMLSELAKPYEPPSPSEQPLRWRYTTYMGEVHPAARKVVVEFKPAALKGLDEKQRLKLLKLAGPRYNPETRTVKMSCESFETQAQNKRYLGDTVQRLIAEAKNPATDSFADVPLDTRHHKSRKQLRFPRAWNVTVEKKQMLEEKRAAALLEEGRKVEADKLVSGVAAIEAARQISLQQAENSPIMADAKAPLPKGKMGKKEMPGQRAGR